MRNFTKHIINILSKKALSFVYKADALCLEKEIDSKHLLLLNVGSGNWNCPGWKCLDYPSQWYSKAQKNCPIIPYDIRNEVLPFENDSVDAIYCSHVVEHIEDEYIQRFFNEAYRVLKLGGAIRVCCPDAEFLYNITKSGKEDYWNWRRNWFASKYWKGDKSIRPIDFLIREIATPKLNGYINSICDNDYTMEFNKLKMEDFLELMKKNLFFRSDFVGEHINYWTYNKMRNMLERAGFTFIMKSKCHGSLSKYMQNPGYFDTTHPQMSLYVEAVK